MAKEKKGSALEIKGKGVPGGVLKEKFGTTLDYYKETLLKNKAAPARFEPSAAKTTWSCTARSPR